MSDILIQNPIGKSDHLTISFTFQGHSKSNSTNLKRDYNKADYKSMKAMLNINWEELLKNKCVKEQWTLLSSKINEAIEKYVPIKNLSNNFSSKGNVPVSHELKRLIRRKEKLWKKFRISGDRPAHEDYKKVRNQVRRHSRKAVKLKEKDIAMSAKENPKKFGSYIKSKSKTKTSIADLYTNESKTTLTDSDEAKANVLGNFFSSVFTIEPDDLLPELNLKDVPVINEIEINLDIVKKKLDALLINKSSGPDGLSARVLKEMSDVIAMPVYILFKNSLQTGTIPQMWKTANITAIYKKGDKKFAGNYRPVSLTCTMCKLLEKTIRESMVNHMKKYNLFSDKQYGFISGRSTVLQLLAVLESWTQSLDVRNDIDVAYCDYMKAFDKVSHRRLIHKLKMYRFGEAFQNWIGDFLAGRKQKVIVNGKESTWGTVTSGIPQGSVLGPILFVLFINDLPEHLPNSSKLYLYADDTKIFREIKDDLDREKLQEDIYSMYEWSERWLLRFHPDKCKTMHIGNNNSEPMSYKLKPDISGMDITTSEKDVGVIIDNKLSFDLHIAEKVNKANSVAGAIRRSFEYLDKDSFKQLYTALVRPHLEYANAVWNPYKKKDITTLENVQRRATKMVPGLGDKSYVDRLRDLKLPTLTYRRIRGDMIEVFKLVNDMYFDCTNLFTFRDQSESVTRRNKKLFKHRARLDVRKYSFRNRVVDLWNSLPDSVISAETVFCFETRLDNYWKDQDILYEYEIS